MPYMMPNGKWRAKRMIHGALKTKVFPTKAEAKKWEAEQTFDNWQQSEIEIPTVCLLEFCTAYMKMASERMSEKTIVEKKLAFKHMFKVLQPDQPVDTVTPKDALAVLRKVALHTSGNAANKDRKNLAAAWEWGRKYYDLPQLNPFATVEKFPADQSPRYVPPESDFWRVYDVANTIDKVFLLFLLHTGARKAEAFRLRWEDVDFHRQQVRIGTRKTAHGGMEYSWLPMTNELKEAMASLRLTTKGGTVFTSQRTGLEYTARQPMMPRLCEAAGVKPFGLHAIRHLAATIMSYSGEMSLPEVQTMLRHKNPNTTARYIKSLGVQPEKIEQVFAKRKGAKITPFAPDKTAIGT